MSARPGRRLRMEKGGLRRMWDMLLKMAAAVAVYVAVSALLWLLWRKRTRTAWLKIFVGLVYGGASVLSNHLGIDYGTMNLNVRDIGPLAAGLFFDPVSGILAGVIGGVERYIAGELWQIGYFTRVACAVSTCLAGFLAAALNRWIYSGERPSVVHSFCLGAVMEVFHMYAILVTNRDEITTAYYVVRTVSLPMVLFTAVGVALCSLIILRFSDEYQGFRLRTPREKTPLFALIQRWLLFVTFAVFAVNTGLGYQMQTRSAYAEASDKLAVIAYDARAIYERNRTINSLIRHANEHSGDNDALFLIIDSNRNMILNEDIFLDGATGVTKQDLEQIVPHLDGDAFVAMFSVYADTELLCVARLINDRYYLLVMTPTALIYQNRDNQLTEALLSDILLFTALFILFSILIENFVVKKLETVNKSLNRITSGHLDEVVNVRSSSEFAALSDDINTTVTALRGYIDAATKRIEEELRLAAAIQESALPRNFSLPGASGELYALMTPARHVGGDFYDFFFLEDHTTLCLVIADVSGKGIPAALFMMRAKTAIKNNAISGKGPAQVLADTNNTLCEGNDAEMFVTVWLGMIDMKTGVMRCANAGHEYPVLCPAGGSYDLVKDRHGLVLAAMEGVRQREYTVELHPGDRLFVYTDGVPEAIDPEEAAYGTDRLVEKLNTLRDCSQEETLRQELEDIRAFAGEAEQFDDITMIGFTFHGM